jgi:hypothetical protein
VAANTRVDLDVRFPRTADNRSSLSADTGSAERRYWLLVW